MSKHDKRLLAVLSGTSDRSLTFEDLRSVLLRLGFDERAPGGSHYTYSRPGVDEILTLPRRRGAVRPVYVKKVRALILKYRLADEGTP